jgi:hypothetical protein
VEASFDRFQSAFKDRYEITRDEVQEYEKSSSAVRVAADMATS